MLMWRFWAGLPMDGCRLGLRCLSAIVASARWLAKAVWWLIVPSNLDYCEFPTGHFVARVGAFSLLGVLFGAEHAERLLMAMTPDANETVAMVFSMFLMVAGAMALAVVNLSVATSLRGKK